MKIQIKLEKEKTPEKEVRRDIDEAARKMRHIHQQRGDGDVSFEKVRARMQREAEKDHRKGKI